MKYFCTGEKDGHKIILIEHKDRLIWFYEDEIFCMNCPYCEFSPAENFGDCGITDEPLWEIDKKIGQHCPIPFPEELKKKYYQR